jgi:hypothetical protein
MLDRAVVVAFVVATDPIVGVATTNAKLMLMPMLMMLAPMLMFLLDAIDVVAYVAADMPTMIQKCGMLLAILLVAMMCRCCQRCCHCFGS